MLLKSSAYLIFAAVFALAAGGSTCARADGPKLDLKKYPAQMSVSTYDDNSYERANRDLYQQAPEDGRFTLSDRVRHESTSAEMCMKEALLAQQDFTFDVMKERNGYTPDTIEQQTAITLSTDPKLVTFLEMTRLVPREDWDGQIDSTTVDTLTPSFKDPKAPLRRKTASLWTVSGQRVVDGASEPEAVVMPWQKEPGVQEYIEGHFDRKKYKYVFEWGRAAQIKAKGMNTEVKPLFAAAAVNDMRRVKAMGGLLSEAWVAVSSGREENIVLWDQLFKGYRFPPEGGNGEEPKDKTWMVPLTKMIEIFKPGEHIQRISKIMELSGNTLPEAGAVALLDQFRLTRYKEMTFHTHREGDLKQPLSISDLSNQLTRRQYALFEQYGIPKDKWLGLQTYLAQFLDNAGLKDSVKYPDLSAYQYFDRLKALHAVEISNLGNPAAQTDPNYVKTALLGSYIDYINGFFDPRIPPGRNIMALVSQLAKDETRFAITTSDPEIRKQLLELHPTYVLQDRFAPGTLKVSYSYVFSMPDITRIMNSPPGFIQQHALHSVYPGTKQAQFLINSLASF